MSFLIQPEKKTNITHIVFYTIILVIIAVIIVLLVYSLASQAVNCSTVPSAPTNLNTHVTTKGRRFFWNFSPIATSYTLYIGKTSGFNKASSTIILSTSDTEITSNIFGNENFVAFVTASNNCGESSKSNEISF